MPKFRVIEPEEIARARQLYEGTSLPVHDIARSLGIGTTTLMKRVKLWGWTPRNKRLAELDAAAKAEVPLAEVREAAAPAIAVVEKATLIERVRAAVESEIAAIESVLQRVESAQLRSSDAERAARTLATLVRTLKELAALERPIETETGEGSEGESRDIDEFRRDLAERLDRLRAGAEI